MKAKELAAKLNETPDREVFIKVGYELRNVYDVLPTGEHRNAVKIMTEPLPSDDSDPANQAS